MTALLCCVWIGKFDKNIFFVNVSTKKSNYIVVQELCQLMGSKEADFPNEFIAFNWLQEFLKEKGPNPLLLILDDVWPKSESLLEKFNDVTIQSNCNILVTSRSSFPRFGSPYPLVALNEKDAMTLFRHSAFRGDESYDVPEGLQDKVSYESVVHNIFLIYHINLQNILHLCLLMH